VAKEYTQIAISDKSENFFVSHLLATTIVSWRGSEAAKLKWLT
jgi:hypothetical protein